MSSQPQGHRSLDPDLAHLEIWKFTLHENPQEPRDYLNDLAEEERQRIDQGIFPELGERATRSRLGLRWILATYLKCPAVEVPLIIGPHGKPDLDPNSMMNPGLFFNLSHCGDYALLAVSRRSPVGVDLERIREESPIEDLAERCFAVEERKKWLSIPEKLRRTSFFHLWVQKEAMVKAHGAGMTLPLRLFSGIADPHQYEGNISSELPEIGNDLWHFHALPAGKDMRSAIVFQGSQNTLIERNPEEVGLSRW